MVGRAFLGVLVPLWQKTDFEPMNTLFKIYDESALILKH
jgi:hypothetical protein